MRPLGARAKVPAQREKARQALEMRIAGHKWEYIATTLGYSDKSHAHRAVQTLQKKRIAETVDEMRRIENDRLDSLQVAVWDKAQEGDIPAQIQALRISERRAKMNGLDAPIQQATTTAGEIIIRYADDTDNPAPPAAVAEDD